MYIYIYTHELPFFPPFISFFSLFLPLLRSLSILSFVGVGGRNTWAPLELTDRFSSSGELVASASHSRDDLGVILKIVDRWREKGGRGRRGERGWTDGGETRECEERRVNSRPLRHTREKTERARQLVLVYGSRNVRRGKTRQRWVSPWPRGQPRNCHTIVEINSKRRIPRQTVPFLFTIIIAIELGKLKLACQARQDGGEWRMPVFPTIIDSSKRIDRF